MLVVAVIFDDYWIGLAVVVAAAVPFRVLLDEGGRERVDQGLMHRRWKYVLLLLLLLLKWRSYWLSYWL
jgi:hypothetical protein